MVAVAIEIEMVKAQNGHQGLSRTGDAFDWCRKACQSRC